MTRQDQDPARYLPVNGNIKQVADPDNSIQRVARNYYETVLCGQLAVSTADGQLSSSRHDELRHGWRVEIKMTELRGFLTWVQE